MQDRWKRNAAKFYEDPAVRVRKRLVTDACKLRRLAETNLPHLTRALQVRHERLAAKAAAVGYDLTHDGRVEEISGKIGEDARAAAVVVVISSGRRRQCYHTCTSSSRNQLTGASIHH